MTDLLPLLEGQPAASAAAGIADKLDAIVAHASAAEHARPSSSCRYRC
jgi:hypothetical protein